MTNQKEQKEQTKMDLLKRENSLLKVETEVLNDLVERYKREIKKQRKDLLRLLKVKGNK
jgi:hypothetical protein